MSKLGLYSLRGKTFYRQIPRRPEAARLDIRNDHVALKFGRHLGNVAAETSAKFQNDWKNVNPNFVVFGLHKTLRNPVRLVNRGLGVGVTKAPFANFSISKIFDIANVPVRFA